MIAPELEEARRLLRIARRDFETVCLLLPLEQASLAAIGFHAQQSTEKALKAVCAFRMIEVRRTYDLVALGHLLVNQGVLLPVSLEQLRVLNPFAVEFRYDDEINPDVPRDEISTVARLSIEWACAIVGS